MRRLIPLVVFVVMAAACAARRPPAPTEAAPAPAGSVPLPSSINVASLIDRGCFTCLERAIAEAKRQNATELVFEAATLLTLRAKELGLPYQPFLETAAAAAKDDAARIALLEIVSAIPLDPLVGDRDQVLSKSVERASAETLKLWLSRIEDAPGSLAFRGYLALAVRCSASRATEKPEPTIAESVRMLPLVRYRLGICGNAYADELRDIRMADAEFVDVDYPLGRYALQGGPYPDVDEAIRRLTAASNAFPRSPAIATYLGDTYQQLEDWGAAVRAYDAALMLVTDHPDALRGRTISLSSLSEHLAAIESATRLVNGQWFRGDGYYWRAWNHFQLGNLDTARADADSMKVLLITSRAFLLSGLIDWRLRRLESAEVEFERSVATNAGQCDASTFLGGVRNEQGKPREALAAFTFAKQCWELLITVGRAAIAKIDASDAKESYKTREIARQERGIAQAEKRRDEAANGIELLQKYLTSIQGPQAPRRQ